MKFITYIFLTILSLIIFSCKTNKNVRFYRDLSAEIITKTDNNRKVIQKNDITKVISKDSFSVKILRIKDGTAHNLAHKLDKTQIDSLPNPTSITRHKFNYLFDALSAIPFSKNIITFSIDFNSTSNGAKIDFKYPLYDELCTIENNTLFDIYLEDFEIVLFKKIYEDYIMNMVDKLFHKDIEVPQNSNLYPQYYTLLKIKVILQESFWKEYNISKWLNIERKLINYNYYQLYLQMKH